jgi:hypothetical protein
MMQNKRMNKILILLGWASNDDFVVNRVVAFLPIDLHDLSADADDAVLRDAIHQLAPRAIRVVDAIRLVVGVCGYEFRALILIGNANHRRGLLFFGEHLREDRNGVHGVHYDNLKITDQNIKNKKLFYCLGTRSQIQIFDTPDLGTPQINRCFVARLGMCSRNWVLRAAFPTSE